MKKLTLIVAVVAVACLSFTSCDRDVRKCYKFQYTLQNVEYTNYEWMSANEADAKVTNLKKTFGEDIKVRKSVASKHKTIEDCVAANIKTTK